MNPRPSERFSRRPRLVPLTVVLAVAVAIGSGPPARAALARHAVPANLEVPDGNRVFLIGEAAGTQNYICLPVRAGFAWTLFGPQATLFGGRGTQIATHFVSPNPEERGTPRPTWQSSLDTSAVWGQAIETSADPNFVEPGAIPWLLLQVVGSEAGPAGGASLTRTTFIQRVNTVGGTAPSTGCSAPEDVGRRLFAPYRASYVFYTNRLRR